MGKKRKSHSAAFKAKVALEAVKGLKTASELASEYQVHPGQISQWKRKLLDGAGDLFEPGNGRGRDKEAEKIQGQLYEKIGRLEVELDWLKKKSEQLG